MEDQLTVRITAPQAELDSLSLWDDDPAAVREWVGTLPMANTAEAATQIRQATFEIARLKTDFPNRMDLLEAIRPTLHYLCARLDRTATATSAHSDAIARLAQRLQTNLCSGYKSVILTALADREAEGALETITLAIHRALSDLSRTLLRTLQFYVAPADRLWLELNQLYLLAERLDVQSERLEDSENHSEPEVSATDAYLRSILLATSKPNQLRHRQLGQVFNALEFWAPNVSIEGQRDDSLFMVDLESDQGPRYAKLLHEPAEPRGIRTEVLVYELEAYLKDMDSRIAVPDYVAEDLLDHIVDAWGVMRQRAFRRAPASGSVKVCVGLRSAHYFLSGGVEFVDQLDLADAILKREVNPFLVDHDNAISITANQPTNTTKDVWDDAFDLRVKIPVNPKIGDPDRVLLQGYGREKGGQTGEADVDGANVNGALHFYDTTALDTSPGGYRIRWNELLPANVQAGELVAMRDATDPRWCVAVIRWIRQDSDGTSMGIELISPRAIPLAVRVINKRGGPSDFTRGLLLPALEPIDQPATLITPLLPFQAGQKIHIQRQGIQTTAQLSQCILKTESVNQFTFRMLDGYLENAQINLNMSDLSEIDGLKSGDS
ncbi:MAG: hypothetical protein OES38_08075 [Gammaproteobacteria bacterium]|nr:hypothetical protein [Gammaproteobacteria bacterium]